MQVSGERETRRVALRGVVATTDAPTDMERDALERQVRSVYAQRFGRRPPTLRDRAAALVTAIFKAWRGSASGESR